MSKGFLILGAIVVGVALVIYVMNQRQKEALIAQNSPGQIGYYAKPGQGVAGPALPVTSQQADYALGSLIANAGAGFNSLIGAAFQSGASSSVQSDVPNSANDPGLDYSSAVDYTGDQNAAAIAEANAYDPSYAVGEENFVSV